MNRFVLLLLSGVGASLVNGSASTQDSPSGLIGEDHWVRVDDQGAPWDAVGQVNVAGYRKVIRCTGTMVAPDLVLTAAHCVMNPWSKKPFPLDAIHFLAAVRGAESKGHSIAKCLHFPNGFEFIAPEKMFPARAVHEMPLRAFTKDVVAIVLDEKLAVDPVPLAEGIVASPTLSLVHAAYPTGRRFVLMAQYNCHLVGSDRESLFWFNDCDTHQATSGGPLFAKLDGEFKLTAIMLGRASHANVAFPIAQWTSLTRNTVCP
jgi:protease YdgD